MIDRNESSAGKPVALHSGQQLRISLSENITTGFHWQLGSPCPELLTLEHDETAPPAPGALGAPRLRSWLFLANAEGHCDLRFDYVRPWQKNAPGKVLTFPVSVTLTP